MENVPDLYRREYSQYQAFTQMLADNNYTFSEKIVDCSDYGVPQSRKRLVVLASRLGAKIELIPPTHKNNIRTVRNTISHLEPLTNGGQSRTDPLHRCSKLSDINYKRIEMTPAGGGWKDWPVDMRLECHKKKTGTTYPSVYGRMKWDDLAPTITTQSYSLGTGRFGHPDQNRAMSLREAALLQTFPESYQFVEPTKKITFKDVGRHIGNAVPVKLAEVIAQSIQNHLESMS